MPDYGELITPEREAKLLGVKTETLAQWRHLRRGPKYLKYGRMVRYSEAWNKEWLDGQVIDPGQSRDGHRLGRRNLDAENPSERGVRP